MPERDITLVPVLPLRNTLLFPGETAPLVVGRSKSVAMLKELKARGQDMLGVFSQRDESVDDPGPDDLYPVGTMAKILKVDSMSEGTYTVLIQGLHRIQATSWHTKAPYLAARISRQRRRGQNDRLVPVLAEQIKRQAKQFVEANPQYDQSVTHIIDGIDDPVLLADLVASQLKSPLAERIRVLEETDIPARLNLVAVLLGREMEILTLSRDIHSQVRNAMDEHQKEYFLREQIKVIQNQLGEGDQDDQELLKAQIEAAHMPAEALEQARKELSRLRHMHPAAPEYQVVRTYLDWLTAMPWDKADHKAVDIQKARTILDEDHHGLKKVKRRILEYLAVHQLKPDIKGPILALIGPPGVGKTSLGKSIARAMGRKFIRMSLGGMRDEAELRGHRRTYIGALPGRIIQNIKRVGVNNPVFMLDEVDKLGNDFRGDPSFALLEALDPEQNDQFSDHYLEVPFDLSQVIFICTGNVVDTIPPALRDRLEIIDVPGYTSEEKMAIARDHLVPEQVAENGLGTDRIRFKDAALDHLIHHYTREAGVRNLKREIAAVCRGVAVDVAAGTVKGRTDVGPKKVEEMLGAPRFQMDMAEAIHKPGVAAGLAWTPTGGDIIFIETTRMPGSGKLTLTGHLGDVMKESAQAALSYLRSRDNGLKDLDFSAMDLHIHVPAGAIPKDGPSAGVTLLSSLYGILTGKRVKTGLAMTGEITLRGKVLPVGGIKEKVLAARRAGYDTVLLPTLNRRDLEEIPPEVLDSLHWQFVDDMEQVLSLVFQDTPPAAAKDVPRGTTAARIPRGPSPAPTAG